jgi:hypothetical protein
LEKDFLIEIVPVGGIPRIDTADLENLWAILADQIQKPLLILRRIQLPDL